MQLEQFIINNMEGINPGTINKEVIVDLENFNNRIVENAFCNVHTVRFESIYCYLLLL